MFITLEGIDRSGKTTQAALLAEALGPQTVQLREPGGTPAGERVRELLKDPALDLTAGAELLLFNAARAQLASEVIGPARERGSTSSATDTSTRPSPIRASPAGSGSSWSSSSTRSSSAIACPI